MPEITILTSAWPEYALLDSGRRRKLERFGMQIISRAETKAWWEPTLPEAEWKRADAVHEEDAPWRMAPNAPHEWTMRWRELTLQARISDTSKHLGVFPEQSPHWEFIQAQGKLFAASQELGPPAGRAGRPRPAAGTPMRAQAADSQPKLLNLFGYTGVASLAAAVAGFAVTHVDASKPAITWARHNQKLSGLENAPIRWILDDALKFVRREIRRGVRYDALVLDPPSFGRGPDGEVWKVETSLPELLALCREVMTEKPSFVLLTMYNLEASSLMLGNMIEQMMRRDQGRVSIGELALAPKPPATQILPLSLWGRWESL